MGRDARGVRGIDLREGDRVIGMDVIHSDEQQVLTVSANGYGKRTSVTDWRVQGRGGIGIIGMVTSERNGEVVKLCLVTANEHFMCITNGGQVIRTEVSQVREVGRNTQGVRVMMLGDNERVVDVAKIEESDDDERPEPTDEAVEGAAQEVDATGEGDAEASHSEADDASEPEPEGDA